MGSRGEAGEDGQDKQPPIISILNSTGKENLDDALEQMKSAEFGRGNTPGFEKNSGNASSQEMKRNIESMLDAQFAKEQDGDDNAEGND